MAIHAPGLDPGTKENKNAKKDMVGELDTIKYGWYSKVLHHYEIFWILYTWIWNTIVT